MNNMFSFIRENALEILIAAVFVFSVCWLFRLIWSAIREERRQRHFRRQQYIDYLERSATTAAPPLTPPEGGE
ncbi:MAG: hypothetical protein K5945_04360 [Bacteroidaceae bacterium]|nr:hypothetical protein [Bacteroidaceae bacterium]